MLRRNVIVYDVTIYINTRSSFPCIHSYGFCLFIDQCQVDLEDLEAIYFRSEGCVLSNFYKCTLKSRGKTFQSAEQLYQLEKAEFHKAYDILDKIMQASTAREVKNISLQIATAPAWYNNKVKVMEKILETKLEQCPEFYTYLNSKCKNKVIIHDDPNPFWGTGLYYDGKNMMGKILEKLRDRNV